LICGLATSSMDVEDTIEPSKRARSIVAGMCDTVDEAALAEMLAPGSRTGKKTLENVYVCSL
jgi:hypothetical protein